MTQYSWSCKNWGERKLGKNVFQQNIYTVLGNMEEVILKIYYVEIFLPPLNPKTIICSFFFAFFELKNE